MILKGSVEEIIFRNDENGYTVISFDNEGTLVDCVGIFPSLSEGEMLKLTGEYKTNSRFGEQFAVDTVDFLKPDDKESIRRYLSGGLFYGVGETTANALVDKFGIYTLEVIENTPEKLTQVSGIGRKKAQDIIESYHATLKMKDSLLFLQKLGLSTALSLKIYKIYEEATVDLVTENPYRLIYDVKGIGFFTADKVAEKLGIERDSEFRLKAGLIHVLQEASGKSGHTCLPFEGFVAEAGKVLGCDDTDRLAALAREMPYQLKFLETEDGEVASLSLNYYAENAIASRLIALKNGFSPLQIDVESEISQYERSAGITLHEKQKDAIRSTVNSGVTVITGGPGTGKTTIINCITALFKQKGLKVALTAPTGRASKRMSEATGEEAKTLHRLLNVLSEDMPTQINPIDFDVVIVDEISMADIYIFNTLLKAMPAGARLIVVGDKDQLPSVSCGNILADVIGSKRFNTVFLTEIYRQAKESMIIVNAHRINNGEMPVTKRDGDFLIDAKSDGRDIMDSVLSMVKTRIPNYLHLDSRDIQVLSPMKKGYVGVESLNTRLQEELNPNGKEFKRGLSTFRVGDKVMQTVNNYNLEWERRGYCAEKGKGVFNGDIGYVESAFDNAMTVEFDDGKVCRYVGGEIDELMLAYCISVHKSQGCEFPVAIIVVSSGAFTIMTRNLLYTAVTRAKELAVIVGDSENISKMIKNNYTAKRYSMLKALLDKAEGKYKKLWGME